MHYNSSDLLVDKTISTSNCM